MVQQIIRAKAVLQENRQLKAALQLRERSHDAVATGRIVGSSFNSPRRFAILSAGSRDGVRIGMPVRSPDGLVGRVVDVGDAGVAHPARLRPGQYRPRAAAARTASR